MVFALLCAPVQSPAEVIMRGPSEKPKVILGKLDPSQIKFGIDDQFSVRNSVLIFYKGEEVFRKPKFHTVKALDFVIWRWENKIARLHTDAVIKGLKNYTFDLVDRALGPPDTLFLDRYTFVLSGE